jgi:hypothetical protein
MRLKQVVMAGLATIATMTSVQAHALTVIFSLRTDYGVGDAAGSTKTVTGYIDNLHEGDNYGFDLNATVTDAADPASLGGGYNLLYIHGTNPAFKVQAGKIIFADAIFGRTTGSFNEVLALYTEDFYSNIFRSDGAVH